MQSQTWAALSICSQPLLPLAGACHAPSATSRAALPSLAPLLPSFGQEVLVQTMWWLCKDICHGAALPFAGPLSDIHFPIDRLTKKPKGFAFITYMIPEHAVKAYAEMDGQVFQVQGLVVSWAVGLQLLGMRVSNAAKGWLLCFAGRVDSSALLMQTQLLLIE